MSTIQGYNGWTNWETWTASWTLDEFIEDLKNEAKQGDLELPSNGDELESLVCGLAHDTLDHLSFKEAINLPIFHIVQYRSEINWQELVEVWF